MSHDAQKSIRRNLHVNSKISKMKVNGIVKVPV
jgi:hypothetical protein